MNDAVDPVYEGIAAFAAELVRGGVTDVVISPGSRSTPLAVSLHAQPALRTWVQIDERSGGFFALGLGRASGVPAVLVCTSGTAAANYLPAVVEAHHGGVPLIACTADRPPELRDWGAGQTIDQVNIYGGATRWATDLPVAGEVGTDHFRVAAMRAVSAATGADPGPVHLNWPLREPLEPLGDVPVTTAEPDEGRAESRPARHAEKSPVSGLSRHERGVIIIGPPAGTGLPAERAVARETCRFAAQVGWPIIGEPLTHVRGVDSVGSVVVAAADRLLSDPDFSSAMAPDVVIRIGRSPTTKPVRLWVERHRPERVVLIDPSEHWNDASFAVTDHVRLEPESVLTSPDTIRATSPWLEAWRTAESRAQAAITSVVDDGPLLSAAVTRTLVGSLAPQSVLMVSNSMPVRELDTFSGGGVAPIVVGNRGASGIDGINSTALGLAAARPDRSAALLTGDLALLHDLGGLLAAARLDLHLTVVCVHKAGGGIFAMLPIAERGADGDFQTLFRTPAGLDLTGLDGLGGIRARTLESAAELAEAIHDTMAARAAGVDLLIVRVDADADLAQHRAVSAAVSAALAGAGP